jgi:hypothetical protein
MNMADRLLSWEARLAAAEEDLVERERLAGLAELTPIEERAFADEHDKLATDRDALDDAYDEWARSRDLAGLGRDVKATARDREARRVDGDRGSAGLHRHISGTERDAAASDRSESADDRLRSAARRQRGAAGRERAAAARENASVLAAARDDEIDSLRNALAARLVIGQAEGVLMVRHQVNEDAAFKLLVKLSEETGLQLREVAARMVRDAVRS